MEPNLPEKFSKLSAIERRRLGSVDLPTSAGSKFLNASGVSNVVTPKRPATYVCSSMCNIMLFSEEEINMAFDTFDVPICPSALQALDQMSIGWRR